MTREITIRNTPSELCRVAGFFLVAQQLSIILYPLYIRSAAPLGTALIDWQKAFVEEPIEVMTDLMGPQRMRQILKEALKKLESQGQVENNWRPFGMEW